MAVDISSMFVTKTSNDGALLKSLPVLNAVLAPFSTAATTLLQDPAKNNPGAIPPTVYDRLKTFKRSKKLTD